MVPKGSGTFQGPHASLSGPTSIISWLSNKQAFPKIDRLLCSIQAEKAFTMGRAGWGTHAPLIHFFLVKCRWIGCFSHETICGARARERSGDPLMPTGDRRGLEGFRAERMDLYKFVQHLHFTGFHNARKRRK